MAVHTPRLCGEPIFLASSAGQGSDVDRKPLDISCRRVADKDGQLVAPAIDAESHQELPVLDSITQITQPATFTDQSQPGFDTQAMPTQASPQQSLSDTEKEADWYAVDPETGEITTEDVETVVVVFDPATGEVISKTPLNKFEDKKGLFEKLAGEQNMEGHASSEAMDSVASQLESAVNKMLDESAKSGQIDEAAARTLREKFNIRDPLNDQEERIKRVQEKAHKLAANMDRLKDVMKVLGASFKGDDDGDAPELDITNVIDQIVKDGKVRQQFAEQQGSKQYPGGTTHEKLKDLYSGHFDDSQDEEAEVTPKRDEL